MLKFPALCIPTELPKHILGLKTNKNTLLVKSKILTDNKID